MGLERSLWKASAWANDCSVLYGLNTKNWDMSLQRKIRLFDDKRLIQTT